MEGKVPDTTAPVVVLNEDGTVHAVSLLQQTQALADALRTDAEVTAGRLIAAATAEADAIRVRVADLRAAIPALENDLSLRRSLGARELAEAENNLGQVRLEANRILEDATARAAQIGSMAEAQADEVMARTQADAELARSVILEQLDQRVRGQAAAEQQARTQLEAEFQTRWMEWEGGLVEAQQVWDREQMQVREEFATQCAADQAEWQIQVNQHIVEYRAAEAELAALRGQIAAESQAADGALAAQYQLAHEEREQLLVQAMAEADAIKAEADQRLVESERVCAERAAQAEADAVAYVGQAKALVTQARTDADTIKSRAKTQAEQVLTETRAAIETAQADAKALVEEAEAQAQALFDQAQVKANTMISAAQGEVDEAKVRARDIVEEAADQANKLRDDWTAKATEISQQSADRSAQMRAEATRLLTQARDEADAMRDEARTMVDQARQETDQMALWRDSVLQEISSLSGVIESLVAPMAQPAAEPASQPATAPHPPVGVQPASVAPSPTVAQRSSTAGQAVAGQTVAGKTVAGSTLVEAFMPGSPTASANRADLLGPFRPPQAPGGPPSAVSFLAEGEQPWVVAPAPVPSWSDLLLPDTSVLDADTGDGIEMPNLPPSFAEFLANWPAEPLNQSPEVLPTETTNTEE